MLGSCKMTDILHPEAPSEERKNCWTWSRGGHKDSQRAGAILSHEDELRELSLFNLEKTLGRPHCSLPEVEGTDFLHEHYRVTQ